MNENEQNPPAEEFEAAYLIELSNGKQFLSNTIHFF